MPRHVSNELNLRDERYYENVFIYNQVPDGWSYKIYSSAWAFNKSTCYKATQVRMVHSAQWGKRGRGSGRLVFEPENCRVSMTSSQTVSQKEHSLKREETFSHLGWEEVIPACLLTDTKRVLFVCFLEGQINTRVTICHYLQYFSFLPPPSPPTSVLPWGPGLSRLCSIPNSLGCSAAC